MLRFRKRLQTKFDLGNGMPDSILPGPNIVSEDTALRGIIYPEIGPAGRQPWHGPPGVNKSQLITLQGPMLSLAPVQVGLRWNYVAGFKGSTVQKSAGPAGQPAPNVPWVDSAEFLNIYNE